MKRILLIVAALAVTGGVASADHRHHGYWKRGGWSGGVVVTAPRVVVAPRYAAPRYYQRVVRQPIYVQRPAIRYRYYNYYQRPTVIAENYPPRAGYYWVSGQWYWSGGEWTWQPGYYQPDPSYQEVNYDYNYPNYSYDDSQGYDHECNHQY
jgi:hypothetical protein